MVRFRFYKDFFKNDTHTLTIGEKTKLFQFLHRVYKNPYSPGLAVEKAEGFYAAMFASKLVVYWTLLERNGELYRIDILKVERF